MKLVYNQEQRTRLDVFLSDSFPEYSRSQIANLIREGEVKVNGTLPKISSTLKINDIIIIPDQIIKRPTPKQLDLNIVYEDDFCIVINKPSGVITHAKGLNNTEGSVATFIKPLVSPELKGNRAGIVHRLDRGTSGVMIAAKTKFAQDYLQRQFAKRQTRKRYIAIITGTLDKEEAIINMPIERNPRKPSSFRVGVNGKSAQTYYKAIGNSDIYTAILLEPKTGRTHQLRVHLKAIGHPIVGDDFYGGEPSKRLMLHASSLEVILPDIGRIEFKAKLPEEFLEYVNINPDSYE